MDVWDPSSSLGHHDAVGDTDAEAARLHGAWPWFTNSRPNSHCSRATVLLPHHALLQGRRPPLPTPGQLPHSPGVSGYRELPQCARLQSRGGPRCCIPTSQERVNYFIRRSVGRHVSVTFKRGSFPKLFSSPDTNPPARNRNLTCCEDNSPSRGKRPHVHCQERIQGARLSRAGGDRVDVNQNHCYDLRHHYCHVGQWPSAPTHL